MDVLSLVDDIAIGNRGAWDRCDCAVFRLECDLRASDVSKKVAL